MADWVVQRTLDCIRLCPECQQVTAWHTHGSGNKSSDLDKTPTVLHKTCRPGP
eukprot:CAMPEP_0203847604 /NCGR_PEP_ID=MMETSP0359-20131031/5110_1 /ASSEMBLY_ACC=CAM_ASM_000338 /TAXON_ID=268821 /ORGANISM="Scrippsiella Hangoei, Strain SHTV-5" /LENGTH=52 /DNA_ID=CAMNT_0050763087 /DNA_START=52 /DNA_END=207 /DNA_ORIENTATION=-